MDEGKSKKGVGSRENGVRKSTQHKINITKAEQTNQMLAYLTNNSHKELLIFDSSINIIHVYLHYRTNSENIQNLGRMKKQKSNKSKSIKGLLIITCLISLFTFSQCVVLLPSGGGHGGHTEHGGGHGDSHHENHRAHRS